MPDTVEKLPDFEEHLVREVDRVLSDPAFQRAPVLRKLLRYLRDETIQTDPGALSQFAIAVDGLGRNEDYDKATESYPRVQISRLRKTLSDYYARKPPGEGLCVFIRHGDYTLHLAPPEIAYPDFLTSHGEDATSARLPVPEPLLLGDGAVEGSVKTPASPRTLIRIFVIACLLFAGAALLFQYSPFSDRNRMTAPPRIALNVASAILTEEGAVGENGRIMVENEARNAIAFSPFSRIGDLENAQYVLDINFGLQAPGKAEVYMHFTDRNDRVLFAKSFPISEDRQEFQENVVDNLVQILAPAGVLARELSRSAGKDPQTDFECFLLTDSGFSQVEGRLEVLDTCIKRFPDSPLAAYWYARAAFNDYLKETGQGKGITHSGNGWTYLGQAFEIDRFNLYANMMAGKVELAQGECSRAQFYFGRVAMRLYMYPNLLSISLAEEYPCLTQEAKGQRVRQVERLVANFQDPDPALKLFMMLDALVIQRRDLAEQVAMEAERGGYRSYEMSKALYTVTKGLADAGYARRHRKEVERVVSQYLWNPASRRIVLDQLTNP